MRVVVGRIGRPHGLRGEVTVEVRTDEPERYFTAGSVLLTDRGPLTVDAVRWAAHLTVRFHELIDRTDAEQWRDTLLEVDRPDDARPDDPDEYYDYQLRGLTVLVQGSPIGVVDSVVHLPAHDLLAVRLPDDREVLVPFVAAVVTDVDLAEGRVTVDPPDGLIDL